MSNVPDGAWAAPPPPTNPGASLWWRILHSWWLLLPLVGMGCLGGAGFLYVGLRARRASWWIPGIVYTAVSVAAFAFLDGSGKRTTVGGWAAGTLLAMWVASIFHACLINSAWLRWQANHVPWYAQQAAPPPVWTGGPYTPAPTGPPSYPPTSAPPAVAGMLPNPGTYFGPGPAAAQQQPQATTPQLSAPEASPPSAIDVNAATSEQLAALPHFHPDRVHQVMTERQARQGFGSVEEFAAAANLAPHEFARIRALLTCAPPHLGSPGQSPPLPYGRVLDV
ncbi:ComEA family DNA-binding protein [Micromonospora sp. NPDC000316]|uniref:ComEA family DNA-binding protein n=1 Tax=Micromonospora sp. NPDC000316 TaxID=3364216 RepID=UPI0036848CBF